MKIQKSNKGITLVALIITVIVLLILATVSINVLQDGGIIVHAKNAQQLYKEASKDESTLLGYYSEYLNEQGDVGLYVMSSQNEITFKGKLPEGIHENIKMEVGDSVIGTGLPILPDGLTWKILGVEKGRLLLVASENVVNSIEINAKEDENGNTGWNDTTKIWEKQEEALHQKCRELINIEGTKAISVRSIISEDIDKIVARDDILIKVDYNNGDEITVNGGGKYHPSFGLVDSITEKYYAKPAYNISPEILGEKIYNLINGSGKRYLFASSEIVYTNNEIRYRICGIGSTGTNTLLKGGVVLWRSSTGATNGTSTYGVRPVIKIRDDATIIKDANAQDTWIIN